MTATNSPGGMQTGVGGVADVSMEAYLALPAIGAGTLDTLLSRCPRAAWYESHLNPTRVIEKSTDDQNIGTIAHSIILEGDKSRVVVIDPEDYPAEKTGNIPKGYTNNGIRQARDIALAAGKIPILLEDWNRVGEMVKAVSEFIDSLAETEPAIHALFQDGGGVSEGSILWQEGPTLCRARPDRMSRDFSLIVDLKFTNQSAEPSHFGRRQIVNMGYYQTAAWYRRGVKVLTNVEPDYIFLACEMEPPHLCSLVGISPRGLEIGAEKNARALAIWQQCVESGRWPGYPNRVAYIDLPMWVDVDWQDQVAAQEGIPYDPGSLYGRNE